MASNPRLGSLSSVLKGAVEGDFRIDFHKDLLKAEMSVDRKIRELRQRDHLGGCFDNIDF